MKKMIFTNDFVFHSPKNEPTYHKWMLDLFRPMITAVVDCEIIELKDMTEGEESFSRKKFFELSGIGNYWKTYITENGLIDNDIEENSALIIGQTRKDLSVEKDNKFLNITDYGEYLGTLCEKFDKVYYLPHPREKRNRESINFLKRYKNAETLKNVNVYTLLANENIKKVVAISSSVLYESQFFNKEYEYLYRPLYNIDEPYGENTFVSVYNEFFNATFWKELLEDFYTPKANCLDVNYFEFCKNKLRNLKNLYWAYSDLDDIQRINKFLNIKIGKKKRFLFCD